MPFTICPETAVNELNKHSPYTQIAVGASGGFLTGYVLLRVGKLLAICVGGVILSVELAVQAGIVTIDWEELFKQHEDAQNSASRTVARSPFRNAEHTDQQLIDKVKGMILSSARLSVAFLGGFLLGFGFA